MTSSFTPVSPVRDFKGDTTINVLSTPAFCPTPAIHTSKLEPIEPTQLFPPITPIHIQPNSPSSLQFGTPDYKRHFSSYLEPTPPPVSAPIMIKTTNDLKLMNMTDSSSSSSSSSSWSSSSSSCSCTLLSSSESDFSSSSFESSSSSGLSKSESSESIQFKWSATP